MWLNEMSLKWNPNLLDKTKFRAFLVPANISKQPKETKKSFEENRNKTENAVAVIDGGAKDTYPPSPFFRRRHQETFGKF